MEERYNSNVASSELLTQKNISLEKYIIDFSRGELPAYTQISNTLYTDEIENYANWLSGMTEIDPEHKERGGVLHVRTSDGKIIFPTNPSVGLNSCGWVLSRKKDKFVPTINIHTHPNNICFSSCGGDTTILLSGGFKDEENNYLIPTGMLVSAYDFNYLIIKSKETPAIVDKDDEYRNSERGPDYYSLLVKSNLVQNNLRPEERRKLLDKIEKESFGEESSRFFNRFFYTFSLANVFKMGFYWSAKDGTYTRFLSEEDVESFLISQVDKEVEKLTNF